MIEFYSKYFKKNYSSKVGQLIYDLKRLLDLEKLEILDENKIVLDPTFKKNLSDEYWKDLNKVYNTLYAKEKELSSTLKKFINKKSENQRSDLKFIDTFAGCGGLSLGLKNAGFNPVYVNEIEPKFLETYYFNHDITLDNYYCGDIKNIATDNELKIKYKNIDLIAGGPPCQGFSMANRQRLIDDPRNKLYKHFLDLLGTIRPKFFIMENVKGMMNKSDEILQDFSTILGSEYSFEMKLLNAKDFGVPQNRERVFVIGSKINKISATEILNDIISSKDDFDDFKLKDALFGLPLLEPKRQKHAKGVENDKIGFKFKLSDKIQNDFTKNINQNRVVKYVSNHTNRFNNERDIEIFSRLPQGCNSLHSSIKEIMPYANRNHIFKDKYFKLNENDYSKTITSHMKLDCNMYIHPTQARGLSPREAARVQTFPDDFIFMGANNTWYAQIGNAVPVKLAEVIGSKIAKYLI